MSLAVALAQVEEIRSLLKTEVERARTQRKLHVLDGRVIDPWAERASLVEGG